MESLLHSLETANPLWAYFILFISAFVENIFPPIPGDTVTVFGAYLVGRGLLSFWGVWISTTLGSIAGFMAIFAIAYWIEWKIIEKYQPKWVEKSKIDRVEHWFRRYGYWVVLVNRFLSGIRSIISLVAGLSKMNSLLVFLLALISCIVWNGALIGMGEILGENWELIKHFLLLYNRIVIIVVVTAIVIFAGYRLYRLKKG
jgi:membrane protein DedA with SNARE-associated domain